jgi:cytochrome P450
MKTAQGYRQLLPLPYGIMRESRRDPLGFLLGGTRRFGDVWRYRVGPWVFHVIAHPDHVRHVLQDHWRNYPRSWLYRFTKDVIGDGLVSTEGDVWRRQRRMVQPAFGPQKVAALAAAMTDATKEMLDRWATLYAGTGKPFDLAAEMIGLTLDVVGRTLLGVDLRGERERIGAAVTVGLAYLEHRITKLASAPLAVPTPRNLRFRASRRVLDGIVYDIIRARREGGVDGRPDLLSLLLSLRDEETGATMTDREVRDHVITFIGAGHETTAIALAWTWYLLAQHPEAMARVREEVGRVLDGRVPTAADLPGLEYTRRVVAEALRIYPPVYGIVKGVVADDEIGGYPIRGGSMVVLSQYVTHRHPEFWPEPETFDPDRFLPERVAARPRFAWFPFLGGPHQCIGEGFAMMEATLVVAMVTQRFRLELAPGAAVKPKPMLSLRPDGGVPMVAERA